MNDKKVKYDALDTMWSFLEMGVQKPNIPVLKEYCEKLRHAMMQKTAGQRNDKPQDVDFNELDTITNIIVIESLCLYLSGSLDKLEAENETSG